MGVCVCIVLSVCVLRCARANIGRSSCTHDERDRQPWSMDSIAGAEYKFSVWLRREDAKIPTLNSIAIDDSILQNRRVSYVMEGTVRYLFVIRLNTIYSHIFHSLVSFCINFGTSPAGPQPIIRCSGLIERDRKFICKKIEKYEITGSQSYRSSGWQSTEMCSECANIKFDLWS